MKFTRSGSATLNCNVHKNCWVQFGILRGLLQNWKLLSKTFIDSTLNPIDILKAGVTDGASWRDWRSLCCDFIICIHDIPWDPSTSFLVRVYSVKVISLEVKGFSATFSCCCTRQFDPEVSKSDRRRISKCTFWWRSFVHPLAGKENTVVITLFGFVYLVGRLEEGRQVFRLASLVLEEPMIWRCFKKSADQFKFNSWLCYGFKFYILYPS